MWNCIFQLVNDCVSIEFKARQNHCPTGIIASSFHRPLDILNGFQLGKTLSKNHLLFLSKALRSPSTLGHTVTPKKVGECTVYARACCKCIFNDDRDFILFF